MNFQRNLVGITKRWELALPTDIDPQGRKERVGHIIETCNERIQGPLFSMAGINHGYRPNPDNPHTAGNPTLLMRACADASFLKGLLKETIKDIEKFVDSNGTVIGPGIAAIAAAGGSGLLTLIPPLLLILAILRELLEHFEDDTRLGEQMENIKNVLLAPENPNPLLRATGLFAWQLFAYKIFQSMQGDLDFEAISYAVIYVSKSLRIRRIIYEVLTFPIVCFIFSSPHHFFHEVKFVCYTNYLSSLCNTSLLRNLKS
ncbi:hypothetical protein [Bacillus cereus group sp. RP43]|uniref:hypothetical protein n=1 Tax=Bacillus cereus group sp. RP43 TaxID=3040260 RepID=UPI003396275C